MRAIEPCLLLGVRGGVLPHARNDVVARGKRLLRIGSLLLRDGQVGTQRMQVQRCRDACGQRDGAGGEFRDESVHVPVVALNEPDAAPAEGRIGA